ncbi:MAG: WD40/YVTN/BNR-like repeat-containing protein [Pyrinomonadaceae bacterium]
MALGSVAIIDATNIWYVSDKEELTNWKDGAVDSARLADPVVAVEFISPEIGWILTKNGAVMATNDGAKTWNERGHVPQSTEFSRIDRIRFANEKVGWVTSGRSVFRTSDEGRTWKRFDVPNKDSASQMIVVDESEFWCVTYGGLVFHTPDGGDTWKSSDLPGAQRNETYPRAIARDELGQIWAGNSFSEPVLYVSSDEGVTWRERRLPIEGGNFRVGSISFAPDGTGRALFRRVPLDSQPPTAILFVSFDAGQTWNSSPIDRLGFVPHRVEFKSSSLGFLLGRKEIAITQDAGATWKSLILLKEDSDNIKPSR